MMQTIFTTPAFITRNAYMYTVIVIRTVLAQRKKVAHTGTLSFPESFKSVCIYV